MIKALRESLENSKRIKCYDPEKALKILIKEVEKWLKFQPRTIKKWEEFYSSRGIKPQMLKKRAQKRDIGVAIYPGGPILIDWKEAQELVNLPVKKGRPKKN